MKTKEFTLSAIADVNDITFGHITLFEQILHSIYKAPDGSALDNCKVLLGITDISDSITFHMSDDPDQGDCLTCKDNDCPTCPILDKCYEDSNSYTQVYEDVVERHLKVVK